MVSTLDAAKRVLVVLLRTLAATYNCAVGVTRDSSDAVIRKAYRTMSCPIDSNFWLTKRVRG